jgi:hypothetical protein
VAPGPNQIPFRKLQAGGGDSVGGHSPTTTVSHYRIALVNSTVWKTAFCGKQTAVISALFLVARGGEPGEVRLGCPLAENLMEVSEVPRVRASRTEFGFRLMYDTAPTVFFCLFSTCLWEMSFFVARLMHCLDVMREEVGRATSIGMLMLSACAVIESMAIKSS